MLKSSESGLFSHAEVSALQGLSAGSTASGSSDRSSRSGGTAATVSSAASAEYDESEDVDDDDFYDDPEESKVDDYIFPNSGTDYLTEDDLDGYSDDELCRGMNEIWARHGRKFKNKWLQRYFNKQDWYEGTIAPDKFNSKYKGIDVENENAELINSMLVSHGYNVNKEHPNG